MTIDEQTRHELYRLVEAHLGERGAVLLMEYLPPVGWGDVATKRDLDAFAAMTKRDLDAFAAMTKRDLDALAAMTKRDLDALDERFELRLGAFEERVDLRFEAQEHAWRSELRGEMNRLLLFLVPTLLTSLGLTAGTTFAVAKLA